MDSMNDMNIVKWHYQDNAFWENNDKTCVRCIRVNVTEHGKEIPEQLSIYSDNPTEFNRVVEEVGHDKITKNTKERVERKKREHETQKYREQQKAQAKKLENLFAMKLEAFEIPTVRDSKNTFMRSKIRRSINAMEVQANITILLLEEYRKKKDAQ